MKTNKDMGITAVTVHASSLWRGQGPWMEAMLHSAGEIVVVLGEVAVIMKALGYSKQDIWAVQLALEESAVNGLRHGNRGDPMKSLRVRCIVGPDDVVAEVEDQGPGFNPALVPDPRLPENRERSSGRGLLLVRHFMTWVGFSERGNKVTLFKRRSPDKPSDSQISEPDRARVAPR